MIMRKFLIVFFLTIMLTNCNQNDANDVSDLATVKNNTQKNTQDENQKNNLEEQKSTSVSESKKALNEAISSLNNVAQEFHWRDTHLIIKKSQNALSEGDFVLSLELSKIVIQQTKLMVEQQEFAKNNWQNLVPVMETK